MVDITSKKCRHQPRLITPRGRHYLKKVEVSNRREFFSERKRDGMVDVSRKRSNHHGYTRAPSYGVEGGNKRQFCSDHKTDGMVHTKRKSRSSGKVQGSSGPGRGDSSAVPNYGNLRTADPVEQRRGRSPSSSARSREGPTS